MVRRKEDYKLEDIDIAYLNYRWEAPIFTKEEKPYHILKLLYDSEEILKHPKKRLQPHLEFVRKVYNSILEVQKEEGGCVIINPLIVKQDSYESSFDKTCYYVVVGNRRLLCLRAIGYSGLVPCIIAIDEDIWGDGTMATKIFERIDVSGVDY